MAKVYLREYASMARVQASKEDIAAPLEPGTENASSPITLSGTAAASAAFAEGTRFIGMTADGIFSYVLGAAPVATANHFRVPAGAILYLGVVPGQKISVIENT